MERKSQIFSLLLPHAFPHLLKSSDFWRHCFLLPRLQRKDFFLLYSIRQQLIKRRGGKAVMSEDDLGCALPSLEGREEQGHKHNSTHTCCCNNVMWLISGEAEESDDDLVCYLPTPHSMPCSLSLSLLLSKKLLPGEGTASFKKPSAL